MRSQIPTVLSLPAHRQRHALIHTINLKTVFPPSTLAANTLLTLVAARPTMPVTTRSKTRSRRVPASTPTVSVLRTVLRSQRPTSETSSPRNSRLLLVLGYNTESAPNHRFKSSQRPVTVRPSPNSVDGVSSPPCARCSFLLVYA